ncbi:acyltransferase [Sutcliffiella sp. NC1]|uniref:acyltransferase n=1 Tax=Sutcliffiella sp. NC1 TaxID=3004096 RepID=UPI0022DE1B01|nr:acyltransferase [Sutcliffiella sp. NC1]WBL14822.1 acyltransferase [Sutcliffiella sp. NC1]
MKLKKIIRQMIIRQTHPNRYNSEVYVKYLKSKGCKIGEGTYFFSPLDTEVDVSRPYLIEIGKYCKITKGVHILAHESRSVLRMKYGKIYNSAKPTKIGDNVFVGMKTIILPGANIGNNVIIGAGSLVTKDIPDNVIVGGNPAKVIMSLDEYKEKREKLLLDEAIFYARRIKENTGRLPTINEMGDFYPLYFSGSINELNNLGVFPRCNGDDREDFIKSINNNQPMFNSFSSFINFVFNKED